MTDTEFTILPGCVLTAYLPYGTNDECILPLTEFAGGASVSYIQGEWIAAGHKMCENSAKITWVLEYPKSVGAEAKLLELGQKFMADNPTEQEFLGTVEDIGTRVVRVRRKAKENAE